MGQDSRSLKLHMGITYYQPKGYSERARWSGFKEMLQKEVDELLINFALIFSDQDRA